jgi:CHAD domain-containing protein
MEVELKYAVPDYETFEQLLSLTHLGDYWLRPAGDQRLTDHYYDTAERAALHGGYAVRLREDAEHGDWIGTLKGVANLSSGAESAEHEREEYELSVPPGAAPEAWPISPARERALQLVGSQPMHEIFAIGQERHKRIIVAGEGTEQQREAAELSLDVVSLLQNSHKQVVYELEIELRPIGTRDDLKALREALAGYQLAPQPRSKFERALAIVDGAAPEQLAASEQEAEPAEPAAPEPAPAKKAARPKSPGVRADETMAEAGRKVLRFHFDRMLDKETDAREGADIEAVHDMRVATRRQRAALALFAHHFQRKTTRRFGGELKALAHLLGAVRDLDVQLKAAQEYRDKLAAPAAEAIQPVLEAWSRERANARAALLAQLNSRDHRTFKKAYRKFLGAKGEGSADTSGDLPAPALVRQVLPGQLWDHYGEVRAYENVMPGADVPTLHALRIASKSLRYALEFFREVLEPAAGGGKTNGIGFAIAAVVALQDHVGELHDADVTIARLHAFLQGQEAGESRLSPETVMAVGQYMKAKQAELRRLHRGAGRPWRVVSGAKLRRVLGKATAGL